MAEATIMFIMEGEYRKYVANCSKQNKDAMTFDEWLKDSHSHIMELNCDVHG